MIQNSLFEEQLPPGVAILRGRIPADEQREWIDLIDRIKSESPFVVPTTKFATSFRVSMTSVGDYGWWSDASGYRCVKEHPETKRKWSAMPEKFRATALSCAKSAGWEKVYAPDACLDKFLSAGDGAARSCACDDTEKDLVSPIVSISLGSSCRFLIGGNRREEKTMKVILDSGDALVMHGPGRLLYHGVKEIFAASSDLISGGGRYSLTFRRNQIA